MPKLQLESQPLFPIVDLTPDNASFVTAYIKCHAGGEDLCRESTSPDHSRILHERLVQSAKIRAIATDCTPQTWRAWMSGYHDFDLIRSIVQGTQLERIVRGTTVHDIISTESNPLGDLEHFERASDFITALPIATHVLIETASHKTVDQIRHRLWGAYLNYLLSTSTVQF